MEKALLGQGSQSRLMASLRDGNGLTHGASAQIIRRKHARLPGLLGAERLRQAEAGLARTRADLAGPDRSDDDTGHA